MLEEAIPIYRIYVFVDFWNYTLSMKEVDEEFFTDWRTFPHVIVSETLKLVSPQSKAEYQGMNIYASYDGRSEKDAKFRKWATTILDTFPGVNVSLVPRQKKRNGPTCPNCHERIQLCPSCGAGMRGMQEKGVDTRLATDMLNLAWERAYDVAVIISSDKDFVPVVESLQTKGIKVIHGAFPPKGASLMQKCWGSIPIPDIRDNFRRK